MSSSDAQQIEELKKELCEVKAKNEKLEKELQQVKDEMNAKIEELEKEVRELKKDHHQQEQRVNRRRRRNLPAELKVEIVDCLPVENAVHFLANVPNRLIIHHCAPGVRRMLKMIDKIAADYARTLSAGNSDGDIRLMNERKYTPDMDIFLRYGAAHCDWFFIRSYHHGFVGYPANFFDNLIQHCYETKVPMKAIHHLVFELPWANPAPWPATLVQPQTGEIKVEELKINDKSKCVQYIVRNKHNPDIAFKLNICFQGGAKCYQEMTNFTMYRLEDVQFGEARK